MGPPGTSAPKVPYDPVQVVEGMFNGSVTRIGYALKDPNDYAPSTKTILAECAKKFHDALDDCEIQLLDAKWYLEHQLRANQLRRETQAQELGTAVKRKHDEIKETDEKGKTEEAAAKKAKTEQAAEQAEAKELPKVKNFQDEKKPSQANGTSEVKKPESQQKPSPENNSNLKDNPNVQMVSKPAEQPRPPPKEQPIPDDFAKPTPPQATPTGTNDDFFESMFGEPTTADMPDDIKDDNDLDFDFTTGAMSLGDNGGGNEDSNTLESMLPGLESFANQPDDNPPDTNNNANNNANVNNNNGANAQDPNGFSTDFDLPSLGDPNVFDDFLNDDILGSADVGANFEGDIDLSDQAMLDMNFDVFD